MSRDLPALLAAASIALASSAAAQTVTVVDLVPQANSNETEQDSEPHLAVDLANPLRIAASAFTPNPTGSKTAAPIYISIDGGATWALSFIVPSGNGMTSDITVGFGGTSGQLYSGILLGGSFLEMNILRSADFTSSAPMTVLVDRAENDQPFVQGSPGPDVGRDRLFAGNNDFNNPGPPGRRTATIDQHLDATAATPPPPSGFSRLLIESRGTGFGNQDGPPIRPAFNLDGTVYAAFYHWTDLVGTRATSDVVVVRDDDWGAGAAPFTALIDSGDGSAGVRVVTNRNVPFCPFPTLGQERIGGALALAVSPLDSGIVYVAWGDRAADTSVCNPGLMAYAVHVRRSTDRGQTWSAFDLRTLPNAIVPSLAINSRGRVGLLYQQLTKVGAINQWVTHFEETDDGWATPPADLVLHTAPAFAPEAKFLPYLGDYAFAMAVGKDFHGIFSGSNAPENSNFPSGVTYQRNAIFAAGRLVGTDGTTAVPVSIDPFYFRVEAIPPSSDFYVRDWTDSATSGDSGLEPSTHPVFHTTSDVWNRRSASPGPFPNDQPANQDAGNGLGTLGDNWAFTRIRRMGPAASGGEVTVSAHFLVSRFGTGSNYENAGGLDPAFPPDPDPTVTFAPAEVGPKIPPAYHWRLPPVLSTHLCLAVELTAPDDPIVPPSLLGTAPGWPTADLRVINDNNKAQRNMGLSTTPSEEGSSGEELTWFALVHNAATLSRDMVLRVEVAPEVLRALGKARLGVIGQREQELQSGMQITLPRMAPGENRWVSLTVEPPSGSPAEKQGALPVFFDEMVGPTAVNGFALAVQPAPRATVIRDVLELHRSVFTRAAALGIRAAREEADLVERLLANRETQVPEAQYLELISKRAAVYGSMLEKLIRTPEGEALGAGRALEKVRTHASRKDLGRLLIAHRSFLEAVDALLTARQLAQGDPADALQMVRWEASIAGRSGLANVACAPRLAKASTDFADAYGRRKLTNKDYPGFLRDQAACHRSLAAAFARANPELKARAADLERAIAGSSIAAVQKAHRGFLLALDPLGGAAP